MQIEKTVDLKVIAIALLICAVGILLFILGNWIMLLAFLGLISVVGLLIIDFNLLYVLFFLGIGLVPNISFDKENLVTLSMVMGFLFLWGLKKIYTREKLKKIDPVILTFILVFFLWNIICSFTSAYYIKGFTSIIKTLIFFIVVYIYYEWISSEKRVNTIFDLMILIGIFITLPILLQFVKYGFALVENFIPIRYTAFFRNPNQMGAILVYAISIATFKFFENKKHKFIYLSLALLMFFALLLTSSRAAWVALFFAVIFFVYHYKLIRRLLLIIPVVLIALLIKYYHEIIVLTRLTRGLNHRDVLWKAASQLINEYPVFGVGPGALGEYMYTYIGYHDSFILQTLYKRIAGNAHNFYLTTGAELGIFGIVLVVSLFLIYVYYYHKSIKINQSVDKRIKVLNVCGGLVLGFFVRSFFESNGVLQKGTLSLDIYFWVILIVTIFYSNIDNSAIREHV